MKGITTSGEPVSCKWTNQVFKPGPWQTKKEMNVLHNQSTDSWTDFETGFQLDLKVNLNVNLSCKKPEYDLCEYPAQRQTDVRA